MLPRARDKDLSVLFDRYNHPVDDLTLDISVPPARQEILDALAARAEEL